MFPFSSLLFLSICCEIFLSYSIAGAAAGIINSISLTDHLNVLEDKREDSPETTEWLSLRRSLFSPHVCHRLPTWPWESSLWGVRVCLVYLNLGHRLLSELCFCSTQHNICGSNKGASLIFATQLARLVLLAAILGPGEIKKGCKDEFGLHCSLKWWNPAWCCVRGTQHSPFLAKQALKRWQRCIFNKFLRQGLVSRAWAGGMMLCHVAMPQATRERSCPALCSSAHPGPDLRHLWWSPPGKMLSQKCQSFVSSLQGHPLLLLCWDQTQILKLQVLIQGLGCSAQAQNATTNFANVTAN